MTHRRRLTLTALTLVACAALTPQAQAAGFQLREQSPSAQGNAFAGITAGGSDLSSLYFNPAVLTQYSDTQFTFGGTYVGLNAKYVDGVSSRTPVLQALGFLYAPGTGAGLNTISGSATHPNAAKSAVLPEFNIMYSVDKDLKIGLSVNVPYGLTTEYDANYIGRYHALKSDLKTIDVTPSIAYRVTNELSVGIGFIMRKADAELSNGVDFGGALALKVGGGLALAGLSTVPVGAGQNSPVGILAMGSPNAAFGTPGFAIPGAWDGTAGLKGSGWGHGVKLGLTYQPSETFRMGLAYNGAMSMTLKGDATFAYPAAMPATDLAALQAAGLRNTKGGADLDLPATASLGFDWKASPTFSLQGEVARTTWSRFKELRVRFDSGAPDSITDESWQDSTFYSLGCTWKTSQAWTFRAGLAYDESAVDDLHRTPRIPDNNRKWISFGCSYSLSKKATIDVGYSRLLVSDGKVMLSAGTSATDINATRGNLSGSIQASINLLGAQLRYTF